MHQQWFAVLTSVTECLLARASDASDIPKFHVQVADLQIQVILSRKLTLRLWCYVLFPKQLDTAIIEADTYLAMTDNNNSSACCMLDSSSTLMRTVVICRQAELPGPESADLWQAVWQCLHRSAAHLWV